MVGWRGYSGGGEEGTKLGGNSELSCSCVEVRTEFGIGLRKEKEVVLGCLDWRFLLGRFLW